MSLDAVIQECANTRWHRSFDDARRSLETGERDRAQSILHSIALTPGIESRYQIEAWYWYRVLGGRPSPDLAKLVMGVIVEVGFDKGHDLLAVYADRTAHYYNHAGGGVVWKRPDDSIDALIDGVLAEARSLVPRIGPWKGKRRPPPGRDRMRLSILTPSGIHFGEGPFERLQRDRLARRLVLSATNLMVKLTTIAFGGGDLFPSN